jgi:hypothetical protein
MLKKVMFAVVPMLLLAGNVFAGDFLTELSGTKANSISDAAIAIEDDGLGGIDVDGLAANAGGKSDEAVEACFRRIGYNHCNYGYGYGFNHCYRPCYTYSYYQPFYCYRPVYHTYVCAPVCYNYWGCY